MKPRVLAYSGNPFVRSLMLSLLTPEMCQVTLLEKSESLLRALGPDTTDVLVLTEQDAADQGLPFFKSAAALAGRPLPVLLLRYRSAVRVSPAYGPKQAAVDFPCDRATLAAALQDVTGIRVPVTSSSPVQAPVRAEVDNAPRDQLTTVFQGLAQQDYYVLLKVARAASQAEILVAYRQRMTELHPDRFRADPAAHAQAEIISKRLNQAFQTLSNPATRGNYDAVLATKAG